MKEDHRLLVLGGLALVGSFFVGVAAVEGISKARLQAKMHGPKQQHKSTVMDDLVKVFGVGLSFYTIIDQAPKMLETATELLGE